MCLVCNYLGDLYETPTDTGKKEPASKGRKKGNQPKAK